MGEDGSAMDKTAGSVLKFSAEKVQNRRRDKTIWIFSVLVGPGEGLVDFESEVILVLEAVSLAFDDLDLVVGPFQFAGVDAVIAMVEDPVFAS